MKDIAVRSGVGHGTVSRVLNNDPRVKKATRERVLSAMQELNYVPSAVARGLSQRRMNTLGLVFPFQQGPVWKPMEYFQVLMDSITATANEAGQDLLLFSDRIWQDVPQSFSALMDRRCDGLLLFNMPLDSSMIETLLTAEMPFVLVNDRRDDPRVACVDVDNRALAAQASRSLLDLGHRRIVFLPGVDRFAHYQWCRDRYEGYQDALTQSGLPVLPLAVDGSLYSAPVQDDLRRLFSLPSGQRPTALFCSNDEMAIQAMSLLRFWGLLVPQDVSVIGVNDTANAAQTDPPLTTVTCPIGEIGRRSVEILLGRTRQASERAPQEILPSRLTVRSSTQAVL